MVKWKPPENPLRMEYRERPDGRLFSAMELEHDGAATVWDHEEAEEVSRWPTWEQALRELRRLADPPA